jgi:hypothetical protein
MWNYLAYTLRPQGQSLLNNDSDQEDLRPLLIGASKQYKRSDWLFIASNTSDGIKPSDPPSVVFPWAGQFLMCSGREAHAQWACFDLGPLGINYHGHQDKLHLALNAYGRDLLVDGGRYSYVRSDFWHYFRGSASHNVILVDGQGQLDKEKEWQQPMHGNYLIADEFDFAVGSCDRGFKHLPGRISHSRAIVYIRDQYWVVVDQIITDRQRHIQPLWHFHPDCSLRLEGNEIVSIDPQVGNLRIIPVAHPGSSLSWQLQIVKGQKHPVQGWWSREYGHICESPVVTYQTKIATSTTFAWVLFPAKGEVPPVQVQCLPAPTGTMRLKITPSGMCTHHVVIQMDDQQVTQLDHGSSFVGKCAILRPDKPPLIAYGHLTDGGGALISQHPPVPQPNTYQMHARG